MDLIAKHFKSTVLSILQRAKRNPKQEPQETRTMRSQQINKEMEIIINKILKQKI